MLVQVLAWGVYTLLTWISYKYLSGELLNAGELCCMQKNAV